MLQVLSIFYNNYNKSVTVHFVAQCAMHVFICTPVHVDTLKTVKSHLQSAVSVLQANLIQKIKKTSYPLSPQLPIQIM